MGWLAGSLVFTIVTWTLMTTLVMSSPVVDQTRPLRVRRTVTADADGEVADLSSSSGRFDLPKRPWGRNNVAVWGKRSAVDLSAEGPAVDKRRWGQKGMALWGKRFYDGGDDNDQSWDEYAPTKRRWGQKHMAIWGKRADADMLNYDADQLEEQKRKWGQKNMALWG